MACPTGRSRRSPRRRAARRAWSSTISTVGTPCWNRSPGSSGRTASAGGSRRWRWGEPGRWTRCGKCCGARCRAAISAPGSAWPPFHPVRSGHAASSTPARPRRPRGRRGPCVRSTPRSRRDPPRRHPVRVSAGAARPAGRTDRARGLSQVLARPAPGIGHYLRRRRSFRPARGSVRSIAFSSGRLAARIAAWLPRTTVNLIGRSSAGRSRGCSLAA